MYKIITLLTLLVFALPVAAADCTTATNFDGYSHRIELNVANGKVVGSSPHTGFVVTTIPLESGETWLKTVANGGLVQNSGNDVKFTDTSGTALDYEFVSDVWDGTTGDGEYHVRMTVDDAIDTPYCAFVGKAGAATLSDPSATWIDYDLVLHFSEDPSGSSPQLYNSVTETNEVTCNNMESGDLIDTELGKGIKSDASNEYCTHSSTTLLDSQTEGVMSLFWTPDPAASYTAFRGIATVSDETTEDGIMFRTFSTSSFAFEIYEIGVSSNGIGTGTGKTVDYHYLADRWYANGHEAYFDNASEGTSSQFAAGWTSADPLTLFTYSDGSTGRWHEGTLTELRIRLDSDMGDDFVLTEQANLDDPGTFVSYGTPVADPGSSGGQVFQIQGIIEE